VDRVETTEIKAGLRRAPGVHLIELRPQAGAPALPRRGVPLIVGFGQHLRSGPGPTRAAFEIERWDQFDGAFHTPGYLGEAVRGFFANGGRRCAVRLVEPVAGHGALAHLFANGGGAEDIEDIDLVCVPDAVHAALSGVKEPTELAPAIASLQSLIVAHCEAMGDRLAILDAPLETMTDLTRHRSALPKSHFAALYAPAICAEARLSRRREITVIVPPSGHVAGIYARSDERIGVRKAPANEIVEGALALQRNFGAVEHALLNDAGINCIRSVLGRGMRVMGARTLSQRQGWTYVPVARVFLELTHRLRYGLRDLVFESNTPSLWEQVRRRIAGHCRELLGAGALAGDGEGEAFFVKCDAETNPPESREAGRLVAEVGLAPTVPAEFVVVRIIHDANGIAVSQT
jgi:hypothetical protein